MEGGPLQKGLESLVAEGLRRHVLDVVLARPEVTRNLSPEALETLRKKVLARLAESEEAGRPHRETALAALRGLQAAAGPLGEVLASLWRLAGESARSGGPAGPREGETGESLSGEDSGARESR